VIVLVHRDSTDYLTIPQPVTYRTLS